jgi:hypothetical protein
MRDPTRGEVNLAVEPSTFVDPDVPAAAAVLPATNEDVTTPPVKVSFLILLPEVS